MDGHVLVTFLESLVLADVVKVVASDDDRTLHLHLNDDTSEDATADAHVARERTLLVNVSPLDRLSTATLVQHTEDATADADVARERTLLVNGSPLDRLSTATLVQHTEDATADAHVARERTLLVNVSPLDPLSEQRNYVNSFRTLANKNMLISVVKTIAKTNV